MRKSRNPKTLGVFVFLCAAIWFVPNAKAEDVQKLNALCKEEGGRLVAAEAKQPYKFYSSEGAKVSFSYSVSIASCVGVVVDYLKNSWEIQDVNKTFVDVGSLFDCNKAGANNMLLDVARRLNGKLFDAHYDEWLDNGEGGRPATVLAPAIPYSRDKCEYLLKKKIAELNLVDEPKW
ncbi:hypothetical protein QD460_25965 [Rhizobium jaguaris]|uniref:hypothetical protein n=1 Tax=Rhizobium jaguaris TaxID=1312183 RepID=UPI0039BFA17B